MIRLLVLSVCVAHSLAGGAGTGFGNAAYRDQRQGAYGSDLAGNNIQATGTLRKRGVIVDPLQGAGLGSDRLSGAGKGRGLGDDYGVSLLQNDDLFRSPNVIDGSFAGSSKGFGGSIGSPKGVGSFGSSKGNGGGSFGSSKISSGSFGSSNGAGSSFGASKGVGSSFGGSSKGVSSFGPSQGSLGVSKGVAPSPFASSKGFDGRAFGTSKNIGIPFGQGKDIGSSLGSSKGFGGSFGGKDFVGGSQPVSGIGRSFSKNNAFPSKGNSFQGNQILNDKSIGGIIGQGNVFSKGFGNQNTLPSKQVASRPFSNDKSFSNDYISSFNKGFGLQGDGNIFGDSSDFLGGRKHGGGISQTDIVGGKNFGGQSGWGNAGSGRFQSGSSGFGKTTSVSSNGAALGNGGFSKNNVDSGFGNFDENKGFGDVRRDYGIGGQNVVGRGGSFSGGSILPTASKGSGFFGQNGFGDVGQDAGLGRFDTGKGIPLGGRGVVGGGKGYNENLYSTNDGRGAVVGGGFGGKAGAGGSGVPFW